MMEFIPSRRGGLGRPARLPVKGCCMPRAFALGLSLLTLALAAVPTQAGMITGTSGVNGLGEFTGTVTYSPLTDTSALLEFQLTNTSPAAHGGYLTGFAFNNPDDKVATFALTSSPAHFELIGAPTFNNSITAGPFGHFDAGAALRANFEGGGNPHHGLGVGQSGTFLFTLTGQSLDKLTVDDFLATSSAPPSNGKGNPPFVARFRGFSDCNPDSDKVPLDYDPPPLHIESTPEPATVLLGAFGVFAGVGAAVIRRRAGR